MLILKTENLKTYFFYKKKVIKALDGVNFFLKEKMTTSLVGESGCGKTTLAKTILGFCPITSGKIYFKDYDLTLKKNENIIRKNIQIVFQNPFLSLDPRYTVLASLLEAVQARKRITKDEAIRKIISYLKFVKLEKDILYRYPHEISGGELQRVCLSRAIINHPPIIILDEPTSNLDIPTAIEIIKLIKELQIKAKLTFLFISHNLKLVKMISDYIFVMYKGKIIEYGDALNLYQRPLHPYTEMLISAANYKLKEDAYFLSKDYLKGCVFFNRCPKRNLACLDDFDFYEPEKDHFVYCVLYKK